MLQCFPNCYETQEMCEKKSVSKESFVLKLYLIKYQSHKMCEEVVNAHLPLLKFVHDWFVTNKMLKNLDNVVFF